MSTGPFGEAEWCCLKCSLGTQDNQFGLLSFLYLSVHLIYMSARAQTKGLTWHRTYYLLPYLKIAR